MAYEDCRTALATALATLVTSGDLQRVYTDSPASVQDTPAAILYDSSGYEAWAFGGLVVPEQEHTQHVRLVLHDANTAYSPTKARALRVKVLDALRAYGGLSGFGSISRVEWDVAGQWAAGGQDFVGIDLRVTFVVNAP